MNKEFCTYNQALALKELGFDEPCFGYYVGLGDNKEDPFKLVQIQSEKEQFQWTDNVYHAPLYQQAFRWFREKYGINSQIAFCEYSIKYENSWKFTFDNPTGRQYWEGGYKTYEVAEQSCLDKLIEICKNK
jgi:hypothetical protein